MCGGAYEPVCESESKLERERERKRDREKAKVRKREVGTKNREAKHLRGTKKPQLGATKSVRKIFPDVAYFADHGLS